jgi:16S rRNA (guanine527-N7)-methyltransferase
VKHRVPVGVGNIFASELDELGIVATQAQQEWMLQYLFGLLDANTRVNLTSITDPEDAIRLHLADSLAALPELLTAPAGRVLDMGSGGGFPGVPLAAVSGREFVLLDSVAKKVTAVASVLGALPTPGATIVVSPERAEEIAGTQGAGFAAVVARALAPLPSLVELAAPLLIDGGLLIALKGSPEPAEYLSGLAAGELAGMAELTRRELTLPHGGEARTIVVYRKTGRPQLTLPRRTGLAQNSPLA